MGAALVGTGRLRTPEDKAGKGQWALVASLQERLKGGGL